MLYRRITIQKRYTIKAGDRSKIVGYLLFVCCGFYYCRKHSGNYAAFYGLW